MPKLQKLQQMDILAEYFDHALSRRIAAFRLQAAPHRSVSLAL
jgi:hypothetical protein